MATAVKVIRSLNDPTVVNFLRLSTDKKLRYAWKRCIISSPALINELSQRFVFEDLIMDKKPKSDIVYNYKNLHIVTPTLLEKIGQLKNSRVGLLATLPIPAPLSIESFEAKRILILDGIDDLGELGTILRSASAFDWEAIWITHTCADPFDPVCIRSSQGALFDLPYRVGSIDNALKHVRRSKNMLKLQFDPSRKGSIKLGLAEADLSESKLPSNLHPELCLLVKGSRTTEASPGTTDFRSVEVGGVKDPSILPVSVSVSSILCSLRDRYF